MNRKANKADIFRDRATNEVVVLDRNGKETFRKLYSANIVSVAHLIYMACKYEERS